MVWLFALGIVWLCVAHKGFREVVFWIAGITAGICIAVVLFAVIHR